MSVTFPQSLAFCSSAFSALANVDLALDQGGALALFRVLQSPALGLRGLQQQNSEWYLKQLLSGRQQKRQVTGPGPTGGLVRIPLSPVRTSEICKMSSAKDTLSPARPGFGVESRLM